MDIASREIVVQTRPRRRTESEAKWLYQTLGTGGWEIKKAVDERDERTVNVDESITTILSDGRPISQLSNYKPNIQSVWHSDNSHNADTTAKKRPNNYQDRYIRGGKKQ